MLLWQEAYFVPGAVTAGFRTLVYDKTWDGKRLSFRYRAEEEDPVALVCLPEGTQLPDAQRVTGGAYVVKLDGKEGEFAWEGTK